MKLGEANLGKLVESPFLVDLLLSLSRGSRILKQILCEDKEIHAFLSEGLRTATAKAMTEEQTTILKVVANLSVDSKSFIH